MAVLLETEGMQRGNYQLLGICCTSNKKMIAQYPSIVAQEFKTLRFFVLNPAGVLSRDEFAE
jgi:hypothetical protein